MTMITTIVTMVTITVVTTGGFSAGRGRQVHQRASALVFGGIPLFMAIVRLLALSHGDTAALAVLVQNLDLTTILVFTVVGAVSALFFVFAMLFQS